MSHEHEEEVKTMLSRGIHPNNAILIREEIRDAIDAYKEGKPKLPNLSFLQAVLCNDLVLAISLCAVEDLLTFPAIVRYCQNVLPEGSWGSNEAVSLYLGIAPEISSDLKPLIKALEDIRMTLKTAALEVGKDDKVSKHLVIGFKILSKVLKPYDQEKLKEEPVDAAIGRQGS